MVLIECLRFDINTTEMPLDMAKMLLWSAVEVNMAIIASKLIQNDMNIRTIADYEFRLTSFTAANIPQTHPRIIIQLVAYRVPTSQPTAESG